MAMVPETFVLKTMSFVFIHHLWAQFPFWQKSVRLGNEHIERLIAIWTDNRQILSS